MTGVEKVAKQAATEFLIHVTFQQFLVVEVPGNKNLPTTPPTSTFHRSTTSTPHYNLCTTPHTKPTTMATRGLAVAQLLNPSTPQQKRFKALDLSRDQRI